MSSVLHSQFKHCRSLPLMDRGTQEDIYTNKVLISCLYIYPNITTEPRNRFA